MSGYAQLANEKNKTVYLRPATAAKQRPKLSTLRAVVAPLAFVIMTLTSVTIGYEVWHRRPPTWKAITPVFTATSYSNTLQFEKGEVCLSRHRKDSFVTRTVSLFLDNEMTASFKPEIVHLEYLGPVNDHHPTCFDPFTVSPPGFKFPSSLCAGQDTLRGAVTFEMKRIDCDDQQITVVPQWEGKSKNGASSSHSVSDVVVSAFHGPTRDALIVPLVVKCNNANLEPPIVFDPLVIPKPVPTAMVTDASVAPNDETSKNHGKAGDAHAHEKIK